MNNMYELSKNLYNQLMTNQSELNQVAYYNFFKNFSFLAKEKYKRILDGSLNTMELSHMLNIGSTINYDLLAEFLLKFTYVNLPGGVYNKDKVQVEIVNCYDEFQKNNLLNTVSHFMFIHEMIKIFVMFVRKNYFQTFFKNLDVINQVESFKENSLDLFHNVNMVLRPGKLIFSRNLKTSRQVLEYIEEEIVKKADLVSLIVDTNNYKELIVYQYNLMIKEIDLYLEFIKYNKPERNVSSKEMEIFENFAISLKEYMVNRIEYLNNPLIKIK